MRRQPLVKLYRNPWSATVTDDDLVRILLMAAIEVDAKLVRMIADGEVEKERDSFGAVLLDPTRTSFVTTSQERVLATIELGPNGAQYLPNGAAKADAHDRHGMPNGALVGEASHCLSDRDFGWGNSAEYNLAIGGGSGLSVEQDSDMVLALLKRVMDTIRTNRDVWLSKQRKNGRHGWYNPDNTPGADYAAVLTMQPRATSNPVV